ncbi:MAG: tRNA 2-thiouridine(34) synthase MnmA [Paludibacteraceae bacterium]|nr:tRNA 2-thiouridine(34) synthase MnmA [Paludibacteraceae bacterium]
MANGKSLNSKSRHRVLLGMSGGIDSTVSAMLLLEQGYEVVGCTFRTFDSMKESCLAREKGCCSIESIMEAKHNAERMGFEHHIVDFRETFRRCVIQNFIDEYMSGRTPNPCVLCNSTIKWGEMLRLADELGCDYIATGHYARIVQRDGHYYLAAAADTHKDQTYFLGMLTEEQLSRTLFPLGGLTKDHVREIARAHGYVKLAEKKESQEICFVTDNDYRSFLRANVPDYNERVRAGEYVDAQGRVLGMHEGFVNYTIGQRKGLGIALGHPAYVTHIDAETNRVTLGTNEDLYASSLTFRAVNPLRLLKDGSPVTAKVRYRSQAVQATVSEKTGSLSFSQPVWGVTPGQSVVLYQDNLVVGGGIII